MDILNNINTPKDIKKLNLDELSILADEIRNLIITKTSKVGGHLGSNIGIVELITSIHYIFNSPIDKIVFDVSHQCYTHKILTGRKEYFTDEDKYKKISGFTNPLESEHDIFKTGHTSTSISQALGLAYARDINKEKYNIVSIIGDGALSGGEAFEALNNASIYKNNLIIIINDNEMSIAENQGGLYNHLKELRDSKGKSSNNIFKILGFQYDYLEEGNNINKLIPFLNKYKNTKRPIILHIHTNKGYGYQPAETKKEKYHKISEYNINNGIELKQKEETTIEYAINILINEIKKNNKITLITAGTPSSIGLYPEIRNKIKDNYIDVGIAESHAVSFSSGLAKGNTKPVFIIQSTFLGRCYDQIAQDLCINKLPAVIIINKTGIINEDQTHLGMFDIPMLSNIPNLLYIVPSTKEELKEAIIYSINNKDKTIIIRLSDNLDNAIKNNIIDYNKPKYSILNKGNKIAIIGLGNFLKLAYDIKDKLSTYNINPTIINPHTLDIDNNTLNKLTTNHEYIIVLEDGSLSGGFGEKIAHFYSKSNIKVLLYGADKEYPDREEKDIQYTKYHLTSELICKDIIDKINLGE